MKTRAEHTGPHRFLIVSVLLVVLIISSQAQYIDVKTIPVASGSQFDIFPSEMSMYGGISIAVDDEMNDPYVNPAKGMRVRGLWLHTSPGFYYMTNDLGSGKTMPLNLTYGSENRFGGVSAAFQTLKPAFSGGNRLGEFQLLRNTSIKNSYLYGMYGSENWIDGLSVGISAFYADLGGIGGVELLYGNASQIEQHGRITDLRIGLVSTGDAGRTFEALILHNRLSMTHTVSFEGWGWWREFLPPQPTVEENIDRTRTWGVHLGYVEHMKNGNWSLGGIFTFNYKTHPKIPNYRIMNIARDPGDTWAYNFGIGIAKETRDFRFGLDMIYEPVLSNTWADTDVPLESVNGRLIPAGGTTVENDFVFSNFHLRFGVGQHSERVNVSMGIQARSIQYVLDQKNYVEEFRRKQRESWTEWTITYGIVIKYPELQIRYLGTLTLGTGSPGTLSLVSASGDFMAGTDFVPAPSGPLTLWETIVLTQKITVSIPISTR
jgi:hypothetical protein